MGRWIDNKWVWEFKWKREWFEWEKSLVDEFFSFLEGTSIDMAGEDHWLWLGMWKFGECCSITSLLGL